MLQVQRQTVGGEKLRKFLEEAKQAQATSVRRIAVGFFETAKYPDGTPVASVAAWNEFGTEHADGRTMSPERPFFRNALPEIRSVARAIVVTKVSPKTLRITKRTANQLGAKAAAIIQQSIVELRQPPNAPLTQIAKSKKRGHIPQSVVSAIMTGDAMSVDANPLIETGFMRLSVTWEIED